MAASKYPRAMGTSQPLQKGIYSPPFWWVITAITPVQQDTFAASRVAPAISQHVRSGCKRYGRRRDGVGATRWGQDRL